jgi:hypothetical protein
VDEDTFVTLDGTLSFTTYPELFPGPKLVTVSVQVIVPLGLTTAGPVFVMPRSVGFGTHVAPSLKVPGVGPLYLDTTANVGEAAVGFVIDIW